MESLVGNSYQLFFNVTEHELSTFLVLAGENWRLRSLDVNKK
jgi:hypothetical protein